MNNESKARIKSFLMLTFSITWICWGSVMIANQFGLLKYGTPFAMILFLIGGNGPPIASYILLKKWGEIIGFKSFLRTYFNFKTSIRNYLMVIILLSIHFIIPILMASTNREVAVYVGLLYLPLNFVGGGLEEIGWRGILQPELEKIFSFIKSTSIVAVIWAVWHLPLWGIIGTYQATISFMMFSVSVIGFSFMLATLKKITNSVFLCILFHTSINSFMGVFMLDQNMSTVLAALLEILISIGIVTVWLKRNARLDMEYTVE
jgi:hypothetical protein